MKTRPKLSTLKALAAEWHQTKNLPLTPDHVTMGSDKCVWWTYKCGHEGIQRIKRRAIRGDGCRQCSRTRGKTHNEYISRVREVHGDGIRVTDTYTKNNVKIKHMCAKCAFVWRAKPNMIMCGTGCPRCSRRISRTPSEYRCDVLKKHSGRIVAVGEYVKSNISIQHMCYKCSNTWHASPHAVLSGTGCPRCKLSKGALATHDFLERSGLKFVKEKTFPDCIDKSKLQFDFYLPYLNTCIEYDGHHHFGPWRTRSTRVLLERFKYTKNHDKIKNAYCKDRGIHLIRIPYWIYDAGELPFFLESQMAEVIHERYWR